MYNVKGPSKIVAKTTRRGISQNFDNIREHMKIKNGECDVNGNGPKPVFQNVSKKVQHQLRHEDVITPQHAEMIKFINESWMLCTESSSDYQSDYVQMGKKSKVCYYEDEPCPHLRDFKPFDLEGWWGRRLYTLITNSVNSKT